MVSSEIIAKTRKNKIRPTRFDCDEANQGKKMIISNLIPFTRLNLIFAFGILISAIIKVFQRSQIGVPKLSIQVMVMLLCLLLTNHKAKTHVKQKIKSMRGIRLEEYPQQLQKRHQTTVNTNENPQPARIPPMVCLTLTDKTKHEFSETLSQSDFHLP